MFKKVPDLFPSQVESVRFELEKGRVLDFSEPGTGKTRSRIEVFAKRRVSGGGCALVIAPKSLLRSAWEVDVRRYAPWLKTSVATAAKRAEAFAVRADIYITNHDAAKWLAAQKPDFFKKFDYLIIDEGDAYKHHTSQRSKAIAKIRRYFKYRCLMNGAPNTNTIMDVWHQAFLIDDGQRLGTSFFAFRSAVAIPEQVGPRAEMVKWVDKEGSEQVVAGLLKDITLRHKLEGLPENREYDVPYFMSTTQAEAYKRMEKDAVLQLKKTDITAVNAAAVVTKVLQIASGAVYDNEDSYHVIDRGRYEMIVDLVEARKHSIVFFLWKHQRDLLVEELKKRGITHMIIDGDVGDKRREEAVAMYQSGMYRVGLLHPKSAAHGLTLTKGTATVWSSPTYDQGWWVQGNHRIFRKGQTEKTETISVLAQGTIEEKVYARRGEKGNRMRSLLELFE
jgi:SNF2 family DNA or RNA helicase